MSVSEQSWRRAGGMAPIRRRVAHFTPRLSASLMTGRLLLFVLCVLTAAPAGCVKPGAVPANATATTAEPPPAPEPGADEYTYLSDVFVAGDSLVHEGFEVVKLSRKVRYEYPPEMREPPDMLDATYAVLRRKGRVLLTFDGVVYGAGNATDFGLFSFLGGETKQLAVSLTAPRLGRHWAVELSPRPRVLFDSYDYEVGREEFAVVDVDKDGVYEISLPVTAFYMFENMYMAETPLPEIIFKYDPRAGKYLPANHLLAGYALRDIEADIARLKETDDRYMSSRLGVLLQYVYAGREREGWDFFAREYRRPDRDELRSKIEAELRGQKLYKFIYAKRTK